MAIRHNWEDDGREGGRDILNVYLMTWLIASLSGAYLFAVAWYISNRLFKSVFVRRIVQSILFSCIFAPAPLPDFDGYYAHAFLVFVFSALFIKEIDAVSLIMLGVFAGASFLFLMFKSKLFSGKKNGEEHIDNDNCKQSQISTKVKG